jgi:hypothetical protein
MESIHCFFHPQPSKGGSSSEPGQSWYAAEVPFRGFRGKSNREYEIKNSEKF